MCILIFVKHDTWSAFIWCDVFYVYTRRLTSPIISINPISKSHLYRFIYSLLLFVRSTLDARSNLANKELNTVMLNQQKRSTLRTVELYPHCTYSVWFWNSIPSQYFSTYPEPTIRLRRRHHSVLSLIS